VGATQRNRKEPGMFIRTQANMQPQGIEFPDTALYPQAFLQVPTKDGESKELAIQNAHDDLLTYLLARIDSDSNRRSARIRRLAHTDKIVSTWQKLTAEDSKRRDKQESTGKSQAIAMNLPVTVTHIDDMVAFFSEVYFPSTGAFTMTPEMATQFETLKPLMDKMNEQAKISDFYSELGIGLRALVKYNIGGYHLDWVVEDVDTESDDESTGINWVCGLDMYNVWWDPVVTNPKKVSKDAEWFAMADVVSRRHLVTRQLDGIYEGVDAILMQGDGNTVEAKTNAAYYRHPPISAGVSAQDETTIASGTSVDWESYGKSLGSDKLELQQGYERVIMYCWLNPADFGLSYDTNLTYTEDGYYLWKFVILNGERIIQAKPVRTEDDDIKNQGKLQIPVFMSLLNKDDMLEATRSIAELMLPFQSFASFLLNAHVAGARGSIYGIKAYDPMMFDLAAAEAVEGTAMNLPSKMPGRDVRSGLQELKGTYDGSQTLNQVGGIMSVMKEFFPAQALPSQVAQIDRAVNSQVAAVMQGVSRRLHMLVKLMDSSIFEPLRFAMYRNLVEKKSVSLSGDGAVDGNVRRVLGNGLDQLNREIIESNVRNVLFAMIQNPKVIENYDVTSIFTYWASLMRIPIDLNQFKMQQRAAPLPAPAAGPDPNAAPPMIPGM